MNIDTNTIAQLRAALSGRTIAKVDLVATNCSGSSCMGSCYGSCSGNCTGSCGGGTYAR